MTDDHVVSAGVVHLTGQEASGVPAYGWRCSCGATSPPIRAVATGGGRITSKARAEALEQARAGGIAHQREARRIAGR